MIKIDITELDTVTDKLDQIPDAGIGAGVELANEYIVNFERLYPSRVQHGADKPYQWQSEKQRRAFFATNGFGGGIPYSRTQTLANSWHTVGSGLDQHVENDAPYAGYVKDEQQQRGHAADNWKKLKQDLAERMGEITRKFEAGIGNWLRKNGMQ